MIPLFDPEAVYRLDRQAMTLDAQPSSQLMARAARAAWNRLTECWPEARQLLILAGPGNNGGDAFALALLALGARLSPRVLTLGDLSRQSPEAARFRQACERQGCAVEAWNGRLPEADLIVDGLLGIGLDKPLRADWLDLIDAVNDHPAPVLAIDIPSGLHGRTGQALPRAVRAAATVSFIARKTGQFLADGPDHCGELSFDDLGLSRAAAASETPAMEWALPKDLIWPLPRRRNSHKYDYGSVLVVGGDREMTGAAMMAGLAALKAGAGLVRLCVHPQQVGSQLALAPELMCCGWDELEQHLPRASLLLVGPGLGHSPEAGDLLRRLQAIDRPLLVDADALQPGFIRGLSSRQRLLTPHAGEAARLLESDTARVQQDRLQTLHHLSDSLGATVLLKGQDTLLGAPGRIPRLCNQGHPAMASAGMGDVLAGMVAGLWAQGLDPFEAATTGACWHVRAARLAMAPGWPSSLMATDLLSRLGEAAADLGGHRHG